MQCNVEMVALLKNVSTNGKIDDIKLVMKDGMLSACAVDLSNSVFVVAESKAPGKEDITLGITGLETLCKYLNGSNGLADFKPTDTELTVVRKGHGYIKLQLLAVDQIPTSVEGEEEAIDNLMKGITVKMQLSSVVSDNVLYYLGLIGGGGAIFKYDAKTKAITASNEPNSPQQFTCELGDAEEGPDEDVQTQVYAEFLIAVLKTAEWPSGEKANPDDIPMIMFSDGGPVIVEQPKCLWAITPVM